MPQFFDDPSDYKKMTEVTYLSADTNHIRYRMIMRYFFVQHERMRDFIYPEDIFAFMQEQSILNYTEEHLTQDLKQLVKWKNIAESYEVKNPRTIEEFNRRNSRYQILPISVEIERMMMRLENQGERFKGSLDVRSFEKLHRVLAEFIEAELDEQQLMDTWQELVSRFTTVKEATSDYMAYLSSEDADFTSERGKLLEFKEKFIRYLRDFILGSHQMAAKIRELLTQKNQVHKRLIQLSTLPEFSPRLEADIQTPEQKLFETQELFQSVHDWFIDRPIQLSEYSLLNQRTDEMIRKITRAIRDLGEERAQRSSRKKDYLHMAKWFHECPTLSEAHQLSATVFGVENSRHYWTQEVDSSDIYSDIWQLEPSVYYLKGRVREYKESTKSTSFTMKQSEKDALTQEYQAQQEKMQALLKTYLIDGEIQPSKHSLIPQEIRRTFLKWFAQGILSNGGLFTNEFGERLELKRLDGSFDLISNDGRLRIEDFKFVMK
jgi:conserved hypothetical protein TIGR02677